MLIDNIFIQNNFLEKEIFDKTVRTFSNSHVINVHSSAFQTCLNLKSVFLPVCTSIQSNAFKDCVNLETVYIPNCARIESRAFQSCRSLSKISITSNILYIGASAFEDCINLQECNLAGVQTLGQACFANCSSLKSISVRYVKSFPNYAFQSCTSLTDVYILNPVNIVNGGFRTASTVFSSTPIVTSSNIGFIHVPEHLYSYYITSTNWVTVSSKIRSFPMGDTWLDRHCGIITFNNGEKKRGIITDITSSRIAFLKDGQTIPPTNVVSISGIDFKNTTKYMISIASSAFQNNGVIENVDIPYCTYIYSSAFYGCSSLRSVSFQACTTIGSSAFQSCSSLQSVSFPACTSIEYSAFDACSSLRSVSFPVCTTIGSYAFRSCSSLQSADFPVCASIGSYAFAYCSSLQSVSFPACTTIGSYAFQSCSSLKSVNAPGCSILYGGAFAYCPNLKTININNFEIHPIEDGYGNHDKLIATRYNDLVVAARDIQNVQNNTIRSIYSYAFQNCASLQTASFLNCTTIGYYAFQSCSSLQSVNFPVCTSIGYSAFQYCSSLQSVSFPVCASIASWAFYSCSSLQSVNFPVCASIGTSAFRSCPSLRSVSFPACATIESYAFYWCSSLQSVNFPACMSIGSWAFYSCSSLQSVNFPVCTSIGYAAFAYCPSLQSVNFPICDTVGSSAFAYCSSLQSVSFPVCATIGSSAFYSCKNLQTVVLKDFASLINSNAFSYVHSLYKVYVTSSAYSRYIEDSIWKTISSHIVSYNPDSVDISEYDIQLTEKVEYDPEITEYTPKPIISNVLKTLVENADYTLTYSNNTGPGTATLIIQGINGYTGRVEKTFNIQKLEFTKFYIDTNKSTDRRFGIYQTQAIDASAPTTIDWGDGTTETVTGNISQKYHTYSQNGQYIVKISDNVKSITGSNSSTYYDVNKMITSVDFEQNVTELGTYVLYYAESLSTLDLSNSNITTLGSSVARYAANVKNIYIGSQLSSIGSYAVQTSGLVENIFVDENNQYYRNIGGGLVSLQNNQLIRADNTLSSIDPSITNLGYGAIQFNSNLTSLTIPNTITSFATAGYAVNYCPNLLCIDFDAQTTTFGRTYGLRGNPRLEYVKIRSNQLTSITNGTFSGCESLRVLDFSERTSSVVPAITAPTTAASNIFYGNSNVVSCIIPDSLFSTWPTSGNWPTWVSQGKITFVKSSEFGGYTISNS